MKFGIGVYTVSGHANLILVHTNPQCMKFSFINLPEIFHHTKNWCMV